MNLRYTRLAKAIASSSTISAPALEKKIRERWVHEVVELGRKAAAREVVLNNLVEAADFVRDNARDDTPEMWIRLDDAIEAAKP